jgi:hypothetical protein
VNGKINVVFGFIYLFCTALIGPTLLAPAYGEYFAANGAATGAVNSMREGTGDTDAIASAVGSTFDAMQARGKVDGLAGGPHAHGNLESLLNIAAGIVLLSFAIAKRFKMLLSLLFIIGAVFHSGMLYLGIVFGMQWALDLTLIGAISLLAAMVLTGVAVATSQREGVT